MKNIFTIAIGIFLSVIICNIFMIISNDEDTELVISSNSFKAFQIGAYKDISKAEEKSKEVSGVVVKNDEYYQVFVGVLKDNKNVNRMMDYLNKNNTYYYIKNIELDYIRETEISRYEELMKNTTSDVAFLKVNEKILEIVGKYYEN